MIYLLTGFMGAGKSFAINRLKLSRDLRNYQLIDLDDEICREMKRSAVFQCIADFGMDSFREVEERILMRYISPNCAFKAEHTLVALGGGALNEKLFERLDQSHSLLLFLDTPFDICYLRIEGDTNRPLALQSKESLEQLYQTRLPLYKRAKFHFKNFEMLEDFFISR